MRDFPIDVFLSYNRRDAETVERIAAALSSKGISVFKDDWNLRGGSEWIPRLEKALSGCGAVAVFVGKSELGRWQRREAFFALQRQTEALPKSEDADLPLIQVILPGGKPVGGFLGQFTWIKLKGSEVSPETLDPLVRAIRREGPDLARSSDHIHSHSPYKDLDAFREEDAPYFFGREAVTGELADIIRRLPFVAVLGPSGCGKSSVVRSGVFHTLRNSASDFPAWDFCAMRPGLLPFHSIAKNVLPLDPRLSPVECELKRDEFAELFQRRSGYLRERLEEVIEGRREDCQFLFFVDQFEEIFRLDLETQKAFVDSLVELSHSPQVTVAITLRNDFYDNATGLAQLRKVFNEPGTLFNLEPLSAEEVERSIVGPAEKVGLEVDPRLVRRLSREAGGDAGKLPLLQSALAELWRKGEGKVLSLEAYEDFGGLAKLTAGRADAAYKKLGPNEKRLLQRALPRLVRLPEDHPTDNRVSAFTKRRARLGEFDLATRDVLRKFADYDTRLLVTDSAGTDGDEDTIELAHEALIHAWSKLEGWVIDNDELIRRRGLLRPRITDWEAASREPDALLKGAHLAWWKEVLEESSDLLAPDEREFLEASLAESKREQEEKEAFLAASVVEAESKLAQEKRTSIRFRGLSVGLALLSIVAIVLYVKAENRRRLALSRQHAARARAERGQDEGRALESAFEAVEVMDTGEADAVYREMLAESRARKVLWHKRPVVDVDFGPKGELVATASGNIVGVWKRNELRRVDALRHKGDVREVAFAPSGNMILTTTDDSRAHLWRARTGGEGGWDKISFGPICAIVSAALSPDETNVAVGCGDGYLRLFDVSTGEQVIEGIHLFEEGALGANIDSHLDVAQPVNSVAYQEDGARLFAVAGEQLWMLDIDGGLRSRLFVLPFDALKLKVRTVGEQTLVMPFGHSVGQIIDPDVGAVDFDVPSIPYVQHTFASGGGADLSFDLRYLARTTSGDIAAISRLGGEAALSVAKLSGHTARINAIAFSKDGYLATAADDRSVRIWRVDPRTLESLTIEIGPNYKYVRSSIAGNGEIVAVGAGFGVHFHDRASGQPILAVRETKNADPLFEPVILRGHSGPVTDSSFAALRPLVITSSADATAAVWDMSVDLPTRPIARLRHDSDDPIVNSTFSTDEKSVLTVGGSDAWIWNWAAESPSPTRLKHEGRVLHARFSADGEHVLGVSEHEIVAWHAPTGTRIEGGMVFDQAIEETVGWDRGVTSTKADMNDAATYVAYVLGDRGRVLRVDYDSETWPTVLETEAWHISLDDRGEHALTMGSSHTEVWKLNGDEHAASIARFASGPMNRADIHPGAEIVVTSDENGDVFVWSVSESREVTRFSHGETPLTQLDFVLGGEVLRTTSTRSVRLHRWEKFVPRNELDSLYHQRRVKTSDDSQSNVNGA